VQWWVRQRSSQDFKNLGEKVILSGLVQLESFAISCQFNQCSLRDLPNQAERLAKFSYLASRPAKREKKPRKQRKKRPLKEHRMGVPALSL